MCGRLARPGHRHGAPQRRWGALKLHSVSFKGFKSFKDEVTIPLGQITYLIGPNGAGKSNILYGLETLSNIITKNEYAPEQGDYFDNDETQEMKLTAVMDLSDDERRTIADRIKNQSAALLSGDLGEWLFKRLKYEISFSGKSTTHTVSLTFMDANYHKFIIRTSDNRKYTIQRRSVEMIHMIGKRLPPLQSSKRDSITMATLINQIDASIVSHMNDLFSGIVHTTPKRAIPKSTSAHESDGITPDGRNILNELHDLPLEKKLEFNKFVDSLTNRSIRIVETKMHGSELALEATEPNLSRKTPHADFGSGQEQLVLLALQLFAGQGTIFMLTKPELHLHARAQKQIHAELKHASGRMQIVVETHSPIFLGTGKGEAVVLITKDQGCSHAAPIRAGNMDIIRRGLGIVHHDSLYHENILFVEGDSEHAAFPRFLSTLGYRHEPKTALFSIGGVGRIKHLRLLLSYFKADGRNVFVILDDSATAHSYTKKLREDGLLDKNIFILEKNFEDTFESATIIEAVAKIPVRPGQKFSLTASGLDTERAKDVRVDEILKKHWRQATGRDFSKTDLAKLLVALPCNKIPDEIKSALRAAMDHFGQGENGDLVGSDKTGELQT